VVAVEGDAAPVVVATAVAAAGRASAADAAVCSGVAAAVSGVDIVNDGSAREYRRTIRPRT
jgi:hypothetical protein